MRARSSQLTSAAALVVTALLCGADPGGTPASSAPAEPASKHQATDEVAALLAEAERCYAVRHKRGMAERALDQAERAQRLAPERFDTNLMVARAVGYRASCMRPGEAKCAVAMRGYRAAEKLIALTPKRVEGHYYAGLNLGLYGEGLGIIQALREGIKGRFEQHTRDAVRIDRYYRSGAPLVAMARYHAMLPWPLHDRERAREIAVEVGARFPGNPRVDFLIADLAIYEGEREQGIRLLRALIAKLPASADDYADGVTVKRWVAARLREVEAS